MAVNDSTVLSHIDSYQGRFMTAGVLERNRLAFRAIKDFRNGGGDSLDESLAAAEHYLFARYMVSNAITSGAQMRLLVLGYDGVKAVAQTNSYTEMAMRHIEAHSSGHSDGILTEDVALAEEFLARIDSAAVYWNASTRFTDGAQLGLGAEVAVSTQRLHARGPMGLVELTSYKWVIEGAYHVRA